jgi:hypothetical protein
VSQDYYISTAFHQEKEPGSKVMTDLDFRKDLFSNIYDTTEGHPAVYPLLRNSFLSSVYVNK